jgi:16S rRNA (uracil1498-N3)-methyltransferase
MAPHRFFVPSESIQGDPISLGGEIAHQLSHVLRLEPGDEIELLDNSGLAWRVRLTQVSARGCMATRLDAYRPQTEPFFTLTLYQGLPKGRKVDLVLQKATELGATTIVPVLAARTVPLVRGENASSRHTRWRRILQEAAEQSGRARIPELGEVVTLPAALADVRPGDLCLAGSLSQDSVPIRERLQALEERPACVRLFVGPEGGFSDDEHSLLRSAGVTLVSLGPRTLRTETAGLAMLAVVAYALGAMDGRSGDGQP